MNYIHYEIFNIPADIRSYVWGKRWPQIVYEWPLEAGSKSESISTESHVKMAKFTAEIN